MKKIYVSRRIAFYFFWKVFNTKALILSARPYLFPEGSPKTQFFEMSQAYFKAGALRPYTSAISLNSDEQFHNIIQYTGHQHISRPLRSGVYLPNCSTYFQDLVGIDIFLKNTGEISRFLGYVQ